MNDAIMSIKELKDFNIKLPDINSQEFDNLSVLCLEVIKNNQKINNKVR